MSTITECYTLTDGGEPLRKRVKLSASNYAFNQAREFVQTTCDRNTNEVFQDILNKVQPYDVEKDIAIAVSGKEESIMPVLHLLPVDAKLLEVKNVTNDIQSQITQLQTYVNELLNASQKAQQKSEDQDRRMEDQNKRIADQDRRMEDQNKIIEDQSKRIADQDRRIADQDRRMEDQNKIIEDQNKRIADQERRIQKLEMFIGSMVSKQDELTQMQVQGRIFARGGSPAE
jgi:DNA repair exonuclease SbcCD ATPase subunit